MMAEEHPEELIDRARSGTLAPEEQSRLEQHLATCAACMEQVALAERFERELAPQPRDELLLGRALDAAMARLQGPAPAARARSWPRRWRLAAAMVLLASGVSAAGVLVARRRSAPAVVDAPAPPRADEVRVPRPAPVPTPPPAAVAAPPSEAPAIAPELRPATARSAVTAATLFERAGKLRREGQVDAAIATYRRLQDSFPEAREARLSFALAGQLLLDRGRPGEALAQLDRLPRTGGDVGEETLVSRATALEQLHRTADAIAAWQTLLSRYPGSIYAGRARARLEELGTHR